METKYVAAIAVPLAQGDSLCSPTLPYNPDATSCALTCVHPGSHTLPYAACLCCPSTQLVGQGTGCGKSLLPQHLTAGRRRKEGNGTHGDEANGRKFLPCEEGHSPAGSWLTGRKTRESKEVSEMLWVIPFQV